MTTSLIGFAECLKFDEPLSYVAALLTVNLSGEPQEFCVSKPTTIDTFRRIIWGCSLEPYLFSSHFLPNIIPSLKTPPKVVFVRQPLLLRSRVLVDVPLLALSEVAHDTKETDSEDLIEVSDPLGSPAKLFLQSHSHFKEDLAIGSPLLSQLARVCSPLEIFTRLDQAIRFVKDALARAGAHQ